MQPPISADTVLQNRYKVTKILGQGGFGRTYLAEDQRRFNELCAIKELIPNATGTSAWEKAQELFNREAAILYQIQHPQIPQFREKFEQDQRLFLVQDYVEGKTYYELLEERKAVGGAFTEAEVLRLMGSLLPVLDYLHGKGIIHRDISPDNIMMRQSDKLPVLIDFGVVKELATRLSTQNITPQTYVGKPGYSPSEQIQTGQAYPSSDLYALAVSAIVLLTAKETTELFDDNLLVWNWQRWVTVNPRFAQILNRMLSHKPGGRYQSVREVIEALDTLNQSTPPKPDVSRMQTVAVGGRPVPVQPPPRHPAPVPPSQDHQVVDNPLAVGAIAAAVVALAGLGSWALVRSIRNASNQTQSPPAQTFATPFLTPTPTPNNEPIVFSKRLNLGPSDTATIRGKLKANETIQYTFDGQEEQGLTAVLVQENGVSLSVLGPNQELIDNAAKQVSFYEGKLPFTGKYTIELTNLPEIQEAQYTLRVRLKEPVVATPTPTPTPIEENTPSPTVETPTPPTNSPGLRLPPIEVPSILKPTPSEEQNSPTVEPTPESESNSTIP
ncbi:serine/threonine-protein kinase [Rivularia sp. UHCC 0363]|uniref:serine/threonine-protein kinase n=1 Tax=Rivularia sp. UHCC 0363 TaxID=3110244 RepID=UPI002B1ED5F3|nr:serine/threonine-protein kinase [Rivularia sp. UHCC 0363]MEA5593228.1 serine/threonine-protein kinase [Rivularia sp. UHCC 0363]